jgi:hypothetical protein
MSEFQQAARVEREAIRGLDRAVARAGREPGWFARLGTGRPLRRLCERGAVRETVVELALMRAGYQEISYRRALRQLAAAMGRRDGAS